MLKKYLKDGAVVKYRNGAIRVVLAERIMGKTSYSHIDRFNDDLTHKHLGLRKLDIVEVSKPLPNHKFTFDYLSDEANLKKWLMFNSVWKRPKPGMTQIELKVSGKTIDICPEVLELVKDLIEKYDLKKKKDGK